MLPMTERYAHFERPGWNRWAFWPWRQRVREEPVELAGRRFFYQPRCFRWRGMVYRIARIEAVWEQLARRNQAARRYFAVRCNNNQHYTLFQDLDLGTWYLVRPVE